MNHPNQFSFLDSQYKVAQKSVAEGWHGADGYITGNLKELLMMA
jgi:hypothetical protein